MMMITSVGAHFSISSRLISFSYTNLWKNWSKQARPYPLRNQVFDTVIETGLQNLTQDVASCLVHFGPDTTQPGCWSALSKLRCPLLLRPRKPRRKDPRNDAGTEEIDELSTRIRLLYDRATGFALGTCGVLAFRIRRTSTIAWGF
jgi:hypothetical protein